MSTAGHLPRCNPVPLANEKLTYLHICLCVHKWQNSPRVWGRQVLFLFPCHFSMQCNVGQSPSLSKAQVFSFWAHDISADSPKISQGFHLVPNLKQTYSRIPTLGLFSKLWPRFLGMGLVFWGKSVVCRFVAVSKRFWPRCPSHQPPVPGSNG